MSGELMRRLDLSHRGEELYALLERQVRLYTMGDSSSLPVETAQELMRSICFTIETSLSLRGKPVDRFPLEDLFLEGCGDIWRLTEEAKTLYAAAKGSDPGFGGIAYRDTQDAVGGFFRAYDLRFFAHDIPCMIDYPLCLPVPESMEGIHFIAEYLRRIILENRFCHCFERREATEALRRFRPEYRELVVNLCEPLFFCALGAILLEKASGFLRLTPEEGNRLYRRFHPWNEAAAAALLQRAAGRLSSELGLWDGAMRAYLAESAGHLLPLLRASSLEGYQNLFCTGEASV